MENVNQILLRRIEELINCEDKAITLKEIKEIMASNILISKEKYENLIEISKKNDDEIQCGCSNWIGKIINRKVVMICRNCGKVK